MTTRTGLRTPPRVAGAPKGLMRFPRHAVATFRLFSAHEQLRVPRPDLFVHRLVERLASAVAPVNLPTGRYALEVDQAGGVLDAELRGLRPERAAFTAGISVLSPTEGGEESLLWEQADAALYEGQRQGWQLHGALRRRGRAHRRRDPGKGARCAPCSRSRASMSPFSPSGACTQTRCSASKPGPPIGRLRLQRPRGGVRRGREARPGHELDRECREAAISRAGELPDEGAAVSQRPPADA